MKNVVKLENHFTSEKLKNSLEEFVDLYNNRRCHESLDNLTPADVYFGRGEKILKASKETKRKTIAMRRKGYFREKAKAV